MNNEQREFLLIVRQPPARLTVQQAAYALGFQEHDVSILVRKKLLKPLGKPPKNGIKFFSTAEILTLAQNRGWLADASNAIHEHWRDKSERRRNGGSSDSGA